MTEIKMRVWDKNRKKMLHFTSKPWVCDEYNSLCWEVDEKEESQGFGRLGLDEDNMEIMLSTGLKDKNGKEIYEGDVVRYEYESNKYCISDIYCELNTKLHRISCDVNKYGTINHIIGLVIPNETIEVISNLYENLELLNNTN